VVAGASNDFRLGRNDSRLHRLPTYQSYLLAASASSTELRTIPGWKFGFPQAIAMMNTAEQRAGNLSQIALTGTQDHRQPDF